MKNIQGRKLARKTGNISDLEKQTILLQIRFFLKSMENI